MSGWSKEWPKVEDAFYWMRWCDGRYRDLPVHVGNINVMCLFDHSYLQRGNIEGQVEFLGPITPADAERVVKLAAGAKAAIQLIHDLYDDEAIPLLMQYQVDGVKEQLQAALEDK